MPCHDPLHAWRSRSGDISIAKEVGDSHHLRLPCGTCLGCRTAQRKAWALRCTLEAQIHKRSCFATLTYSNESLPPTLDPPETQRFLKRLRKAMGPTRPLRYFLAGEYGETTARPHYHALLYGVDVGEQELIEKAWGHGHTRTAELTPARIAYCAGYTAAKLDWRHDRRYDVVDPTTGEVLYEHQPPFIRMSRRPGIGGHARQWASSWRLYAIMNGQKQPVPRYLHQAWKSLATEEDIEKLMNEKATITTNRYQNNPIPEGTDWRDYEKQQLRAAGELALARHRIKQQKRKLD